MLFLIFRRQGGLFIIILYIFYVIFNFQKKRKVTCAGYNNIYLCYFLIFRRQIGLFIIILYILILVIFDFQTEGRMRSLLAILVYMYQNGGYNNIVFVFRLKNRNYIIGAILPPIVIR